MKRRHIHLVASLDVEEEGLFHNSYSLSVQQPVANVGRISLLGPLLRLGLRPTLFCDNAVFESDAAWAAIESLAERHPLEIGAHMHHWNTPPIVLEGTAALSVPSRDLTAEQFSAKLDHVLEAGKKRLGSRPSSFRLGKWGIRREHWKLIAEAGIQRDASVRPLHAADAEHMRPNHFTAPSSPYLIPAAGRAIVELPLTVTPLLPCLPRLVQEYSPALHRNFQQWGALALLPVYHPLWAMKAVTRLFIARGGSTLSLTWHSSEMFPGGNPLLATQQKIDALLSKLRAYLIWLCSSCDVEFMTLGEFDSSRRHTLAAACCPADADWSVCR